jgi:hypothetical protein
MGFSTFEKEVSMGKAYHNRKSERERPVGDFYSTPKSLVWALMNQTDELSSFDPVWEPAAGTGQICEALHKYGIYSKATDLYPGVHYIQKKDFLDEERMTGEEEVWGTIMTNPPFSFWDQFVFRALSLARQKVIMLGRLNYFGCVGRSKSGIWDSLKAVYVFNRMVDYRTPDREDGHFHVGGLVTGWFVWGNRGMNSAPTIHVLDVFKYAALGQYKEGLYDSLH